MARSKKRLAPDYTELIVPVYNALKSLGGSGTNKEILEQVIKDLNLSDEIVDESHLGSENQTELGYQCAWARTYLKNYGVITNSARSVWAINPQYTGDVKLDPKEIVTFANKRNAERRDNAKKYDNSAKNIPDDGIDNNDDVEFPDEIKPWKQRLSEVLLSMDPYAFERLAQRVLRECGFTQVEVTKKSNDGGIDGTGKLKINGIFSFNVAFQCKRYKGQVSASDVRDFRGSLTTDIEKGVLITTGTFTKAAKEEASNPGKQQIDLIDGEEFMNKIAEYGIGVKPVITYEIDEKFFSTI